MKYKKVDSTREFFNYFSETDSHPTADWLYETLKKEMSGLSLGTVYRNLNILVDQGLIHRMTNGAIEDRFEARLSPHYHITCGKCGRVVEKIRKKQDRLKSLTIGSTFLACAIHVYQNRFHIVGS